MVTVTGYKERISHDGRPFIALVLQGGVEIIKSQAGTLYATARKCNVASTFDVETCKALIGKEIPGTIEKIEVEPYQYTNPDTGEILFLNHRYTYFPEIEKGTSVVVNGLDLEDAHLQTA